MNSDLCKQALAKVGNPNVLVNLISRRVRQLTTGGGSSSRPLISDTAGLGAADIAMTEVIHDKLGWEVDELKAAEQNEPVRKRRKKG
jgi:DNA-directed RNA polymerase subunit omega